MYMNSVFLVFLLIFIFILRLGKSSRVHESIQKFTEDHIIKTKNLVKIEDLKALYRSQPVIASTCLSANNHPAFTDKFFDYCIVDEAGQSLLLSAIGMYLYCTALVW